jgi:uncharacterized protein YbaR (Trm112 family)
MRFLVSLQTSTTQVCCRVCRRYSTLPGRFWPKAAVSLDRPQRTTVDMPWLKCALLCQSHLRVATSYPLDSFSPNSPKSYPFTSLACPCQYPMPASPVFRIAVTESSRNDRRFPTSALDLLCCPRDGGAFLGEFDTEFVSEGAVSCRRCASPYPIEEGILRLLNPDALDQVSRENRVVFEYNSATEGFEQDLREESLAEIKPTMDALAPLDGCRVLKYGCANGRYTVRMAPRTSLLVAVDFSIAAPRKVSSRVQSTRNIALVQADVLHPVAQSGKFDGALYNGWRKNGAAAIVAMRETDPTAYVKVQLVPRENIAPSRPRPLAGMTDADWEIALGIRWRPTIGEHISSKLIAAKMPPFRPADNTRVSSLAGKDCPAKMGRMNHGTGAGTPEVPST